MPVVNIQRIADGSGVLAPQERALKLPAGWTVVDHPEDSLSGTPGAEGQVTGYLELVSPEASQRGTATTVGAVVAVLGTVAIATSSGGIVELNVIAYDVADHVLATWWKRFPFFRAGTGDPMFGGAVDIVPPDVDASLSGADVGATVATAGDSFVTVAALGKAGKTLSWVATIRTLFAH